MELYQLKCFMAAATTENFSKAAEQVHTSQSSLSKIITRLESELGFSLFERTKGRVSLNTNGILFQKYVAIALESLDKGVDVVKSASKLSENIVRIGCTSSLWIDSILEEAQAEIIDCVLEVENFSHDEIIERFEKLEYDIGFIESDFEFTSDSFEKISKQMFVVLLNKSHPCAGLKQFPPAQITNEIVCFTGKKDEKMFLMRMFASEGISPRVFAEYPNAKATAKLINSGAAIGIVPFELFFHRKRATPDIALRAIPISPRWYRNLYMFRAPALEAESLSFMSRMYEFLKAKLLKECRLIKEYYQSQGIDLMETED